jgi:GxxExxY protein
MTLELELRGHSVARQVAISTSYKGVVLGTQRLDMIVDDKVVVEVKSTLDLHRGGK